MSQNDIFFKNFEVSKDPTIPCPLFFSNHCQADDRMLGTSRHSTVSKKMLTWQHC